MEFVSYTKSIAPIHLDSRGRKRAIGLPIKEFNRLMEYLEELEDAVALEEAIANAEGAIDYQQVGEELKQDGRV